RLRAGSNRRVGRQPPDMPNEALLSRVDGLRDRYAQRLKAVTVLQASFKGLSDAQNKVQRPLRDFAAADAGIDMDPAQETFTQARLKEDAIDPLTPSLRRESKALAALTAALRDAAAALRSLPVDVVRLDKALTLLGAQRQADVAAQLPELREELDVAQRG